MGRRSRCTSLILLWGLATTVAGCAAPSLKMPFAGKREPAAAVADGSRKSKEDNPFRQPDKSTDPAVAKSSAAGSDADGAAASSSRPAAGDHDAATLALIDQESRDAPLEEREALFRELKGQHPDVVRHILRVRRMGLNYQKQQLAASTHSPPVDPSPNPLGTGERTTQTAFTNTSARTAPAAGLGASTPWAAGTAAPGYSPPAPPTAAAGRWPADRSTTPAVTAAGAGPSGPTTLASAAVPGQSPATAPPNTAGSQTPPLAAGQVPFAGTPAANAVPQHDVFAANSPAVVTPADPARSGGMLQNLPFRNNVAHVAGAMNSALGNLIPGQYDQAANVQRANFNGATVANPSNLPNPPAEAGQFAPPTWPETLLRLISIAEAEAAAARTGPSEAEQQAWLEKQVHLRMLYLMAGQQERALQAIPGLEPADQEFWQQTFWALANYFDFRSIPASSDRATQTVSQLTTAVLRLQEKANLSLRNVTFCHKISSFGNYERFPRDEFSPGQPVLLYCEVENFHSEPTQDGQYRTILASSLEIYKPGPNGALVEKIPLPAPATEDICRNHRRDYFHSYEFTVPSRLALGPHVLKLTVEDQLSRKVASYTLNFTVK